MKVSTYVIAILSIIALIAVCDIMLIGIPKPEREIERVDCMFKDFALGCVTIYKKQE